MENKNNNNFLEPVADAILDVSGIVLVAGLSLVGNVTVLAFKTLGYVTTLFIDSAEILYQLATGTYEYGENEIIEMNMVNETYEIASTKTNLLKIDTSDLENKYREIKPIKKNKNIIDIKPIKDKSKFIELGSIFDYEIPNFAKYESNTDNLKENSLNCCIGVKHKGKKMFIDFFRDGSLLVGGASQWGKTSLLYCILLSLMQRYESDYLKIVLVDFKEVDLIRLENKKHIVGNCITDEKKFLDMLDWIEEKIQSRKQDFKKMGVVNIKEYNEKSEYKHQVVLIVIDEIGQILNGDKKHDDNIRAKLHTIICKCMAFGFYFIVCTQELSRETLGKMKINFTQSIGFRCGDKTGADLIIKNAELEDITIVGRGKIENSNGITEFQSYLVDIDMFKSIENK